MRSVSRSGRRFAGLTLAAVLLFAPAAQADPQQPDLTWADAPAVAFDVAVLRPLSAVATVVGVPLFVATAPFAAVAGQFMASLDVFVLAPADYTFRRPLADF